MKKLISAYTLLLLLAVAVCVHAGAITYTYDNAGRLTKADYGGGKSITYTYDNAGNLLSRVIAGQVTHTLTVTKSGTGSGTVTSSPAGIDCGTDCNETYNHGTAVTLTATPDMGSTFAGWSGDPDCSDGQVTMNGNKTCTATFNLMLALTVTKVGSGSGTVTSSPSGIDCGTDCSESYAGSTLVTLTATPKSGSTFAGWRGACKGTGPCTLTMDSAKTATAVFITPLTIGASALEGEVGVAYHGSLGIRGGLPPYAVSVVKGALPPGLSPNSEGIVGTPTKAGNSGFTVQVTDDLRSAVSKKVSMKVLKAVSIATKSLGKGKVGKKYNAALKVTGGKKPYVWSLVSGSLPGGLSLDPPTGKITGTPTESGSFNLTFQVTDALSGTASKGLLLNIN